MSTTSSALQASTVVDECSVFNLNLESAELVSRKKIGKYITNFIGHRINSN